MADYSKQWIDKYDSEGMIPDFDILKEANLLKPDTYTPIICEGFGFVAIGKDKNENIILAIPQPYNNKQTVEWVPYNEIIT